MSDVSLQVDAQEREEREALDGAAEVFSRARQNALKNGRAIVEQQGGFLVRVHPDGREERLGPADPWVKVGPGKRIPLK